MAGSAAGLRPGGLLARTGASRPLRLRPASGQAGAPLPSRAQGAAAAPGEPAAGQPSRARQAGHRVLRPGIPRQGSPGPGGPAFRGGHGPPGKAFRGGSSGSQAFRSGGSGSGGQALRGGGPGPRGRAFRGGSQVARPSALAGQVRRPGAARRWPGPRGKAFRGHRPGRIGFARAFWAGRTALRGRSGPARAAFRRRGSGPGGSALRGAGHGPRAKAFRRRGGPGRAFPGSRPGPGRSLLAGSGTSPRAEIRPDARLPGGSAFGSPRRVLTARPVTLRLRAPRRRDGVLAAAWHGARSGAGGWPAARSGCGSAGRGAVTGWWPAWRRPAAGSGNAHAGCPAIPGGFARRATLAAGGPCSGRQAGQVPLRAAFAADGLDAAQAGSQVGALADRQQPGRRLAMIPASGGAWLVLYVVVAALLLGLGVRVWYMQVGSGASYASQASQSGSGRSSSPRCAARSSTTAARRWSTATPRWWSRSACRAVEAAGRGAAVLSRLARLLQHQRDQLLAARSGCARRESASRAGRDRRISPSRSRRTCRPGSALRCSRTSGCIPGVTAAVQPVTRYHQPISTDLAQTLGYLQPITASELKQQGLPVTGFSGVDLVGQAGLELQYDRELRGVPGDNQARGERGRAGDRNHQPVRPQPGDYLVTSINAASPAGRRGGTGRRRPAGPGRRQPGQQGRGGRGDDDHRPGARAGQLPDLQPERLDRRDLARRVQARCSARTAASRS